MASQKTPLADFLLEKYLEWQAEQGRRLSQVAFARHLGVSRSSLTKWMSGEYSGMEVNTAHIIAASLGPEIYDVLGVPRQDPTARALISNWSKLTDEQLDTIREWVIGFGVGLDRHAATERGRIKVSEGTATRQARRQRIKT